VPRILLVEDNDINRDLIRRRLEQRGHEVVLAVSGEEAVKLTLAQTPEVVLMKFGLPGIDGGTVTQCLKANPRTQLVPVIIFSNLTNREQALAAGCDSFQAMPMQMSVLQETIQQLVEATIPHANAVEEDDDGEVAFGKGVAGASSTGEDTAILTTSQVQSATATPPKPVPRPRPSIADALVLPNVAKNAPSVSASGPAPTIPGHTKRILVVEDNDANRVILCRRLERLGHLPVEATGGQAALDIICKQEIDLVLLDVTLPEMDGTQVLTELKSRDETKSLPVIMIASLDATENLIRCLELGADDFISKPFDPILLKTRLAAVLNPRRHSEAVAALTHAIDEMAADRFECDSISAIAERTDALGLLAQSIQRLGESRLPSASD